VSQWNIDDLLTTNESAALIVSSISSASHIIVSHQLRCFAYAFPQRVETFVFLLVVRKQSVDEAAALRTQFAQLEIDWLNQYDCCGARRVDALTRSTFFLIFFFCLLLVPRLLSIAMHGSHEFAS